MNRAWTWLIVTALGSATGIYVGLMISNSAL
jgi:hypothetical protein